MTLSSSRKARFMEITVNKEFRQSFPIAAILKQNLPLILVASALVIGVMVSPTFSVTVNELREPVNNLKSTVFGGWMWLPKIGAAAAGCIMSLFKQSLAPLATGAGIGLGIHFFDTYLGIPGAGALI